MKKIKANNNNDILIGILLFMPFYIIVFTIINLLKLNGPHNYVLLPIVMYIPIIMGLILSYSKKTNKTLFYIILMILILGLYFYCDTYFIENFGWKSVSSYLLWVINTMLYRILSCVLYGKMFGTRKSIVLFIIYLIIIGLSLLLGFWD